MKKIIPVFGLAALLLSILPLCRGQVIYANLPNSDPYTKTFAYLIGGSPQQEVALRFTAGASLFLDYADLRIWNQFGAGTPTVNVALLADTGASAPGAILEQTSVAVPALSSLLPWVRAEFSNTLFLTAGQLYWLAVSPADGTTNSGWEETGTPSGLGATDFNAIGFTDPWEIINTRPEGGARIFGAATGAVPEPGTFGLAGGGGLLALVLFTRRGTKRK